MRILLLMDGLETGGTERQMELLIRFFPAPHEIHVATMGGESAETLRWRQFAVVHELDRRRIPDLRLPVAVRAMVRGGNYDVVLAAHRFSGLIAKLARLIGSGARVVCSIRGWHPWGMKQRVLYEFLDPILMILASAIIVNSQHGGRPLTWLPWTRGRICRIRNGLETSIPADQGAEDVRPELGIEVGCPIIACVGRLAEVKRPWLAVDLLVQLDRRGHRAHLVWVGDGPLREDVLRRAREGGVAGRVHLVGEQANPRQYLASSTLFFHPSRWENTSNAILEAMVCSLPVVAMRVGGNPEILVDGRTGFLVDPDSSSNSAEIVTGLLDDTRRAERVGIAAREWVLRTFSVEQMVREHVEVLESCVGSRCPT